MLSYGISKEEPLGFRYNPKQVIKLMGKRYLTGPVIFHRYTDDGKFAPPDHERYVCHPEVSGNCQCHADG